MFQRFVSNVSEQELSMQNTYIKYVAEDRLQKRFMNYQTVLMMAQSADRISEDVGTDYKALTAVSIESESKDTDIQATPPYC